MSPDTKESACWFIILSLRFCFPVFLDDLDILFDQGLAHIELCGDVVLRDSIAVELADLLECLYVPVARPGFIPLISRHSP
jgi:hypothetical protein